MQPLNFTIMKRLSVEGCDLLDGLLNALMPLLDGTPEGERSVISLLEALALPDNT